MTITFFALSGYNKEEVIKVRKAVLELKPKVVICQYPKEAGFYNKYIKDVTFKYLEEEPRFSGRKDVTKESIYSREKNMVRVIKEYANETTVVIATDIHFRTSPMDEKTPSSFILANFPNITVIKNNQ